MILSGLARLSEKVLCLFIQYLLATSSLAKLLHGLKLTHRFTHLGILHITCTLKLMRLTWGKSKGLLIGWPVLLVFISESCRKCIHFLGKISEQLINIHWHHMEDQCKSWSDTGFTKINVEEGPNSKKKGKGTPVWIFSKKKNSTIHFKNT